MLHLLDANTIIESSKKFYQFNRVRPFWDWLIFHANLGNVKVPFEIYEEVLKGNKDEFVTWFGAEEIRKTLQLDEQVNKNKLLEVVNVGYASNLNEIEYEKMGRDPFVIAYAMAASNRCVVTLEIPGNNIRHNSKIPNVCQKLNVHSISLWTIIESLDFSINWDKKPK